MTEWERRVRANHPPADFIVTREILEEQRAQPNLFIFYMDLQRRLAARGLNIDPELPPTHNRLGEILACVSLDSDREGRGLLSVLVVNSDGGRPSGPFFDFARDAEGTCGVRQPRTGAAEEIFAREVATVIRR